MISSDFQSKVSFFFLCVCVRVLGGVVFCLQNLASIFKFLPHIFCFNRFEVSINWNLCSAHHFANEILHGSSWFLGMEPALVRFNSAGSAFDAQSHSIRSLNEVLAKSEPFAQKHLWGYQHPKTSNNSDDVIVLMWTWGNSLAISKGIQCFVDNADWLENLICTWCVDQSLW